MDVVTLGAALNGSKKYTDQVTQSLMGGVHYRGSVSYYDDLPNDASEGDSYTVKYAGTSGSVADGTEYTWGYDTDSQTYAWISFSKDAYSKAETDDTFVKKIDEYNAGKTVPQGTSETIDGTTYTVGNGAEIFNNYSANKAAGAFSHAEGCATNTIGFSSHAEGTSTSASGSESHSEGNGSKASGQAAHAEGFGTQATGAGTHSEGTGAKAIGAYSHAEGGGTETSGRYAHAEGQGTKASSDHQHVQGKYNAEDSSDTYSFIIGNGTANNTRSNAFAIDWQGKIYTNNAATGVDVCTDLQSKIDSTHKLSADLVDDSSATHKFATSAQLSQITTNQGNIEGQQNTTATGGTGYAIINGIRLYANPSGTPPTGDIPDGSYGLF